MFNEPGIPRFFKVGVRSLLLRFILKLTQSDPSDLDIPLSTIPLRRLEAAVSDGFTAALYPQAYDDLGINQPSPLIAGIPDTDTYFCNEGYGLIRYRSDRFGFRNNDNIWEQKISRLMIGDSFVHGACVADNETLPSQLGEQLDEVVANLGTIGNNPSHYFTYAHLFIPRLKPRVVYLIFYPNDNGHWSASAIEKTYIVENMPLFSAEGLQLDNIKAQIDSGLRIISIAADIEAQNATRKIKSYLVRALEAFERHASLPTIRKSLGAFDEFEATRRAITTTYELCQEHICEVIIGFIPNSHYWRPDFRAEEYAVNLRLTANEFGLAFVDGRNFLDRDKGSLDYAVRGPHLSPRGYSKMADEMADP